MSSSPLPHAVTGALESAAFLDPPAKAVGKAIRKAVPPGAAKDALSGTWLGHALHPWLTDFVIGSWTSALILDLIGGRDARAATERLVAVGLVSTPVTVASGWTDWADTEPGSDPVRRLGVVHAVANAAAAGVMAASYVARRRGATGRGKLLTAVGMGLVTAGGFLGGHLSYARGVGVDTTALEKDVDDWTATVPDSSLQEGQPLSAMAGATAVLLVRQTGRIYALANRCAHRGGPLADGELGDGTITCPWHASCFRLEDGSVERGPSAYPQPAFDTRVVDGKVEVRARASKSFVAT